MKKEIIDMYHIIQSEACKTPASITRLQIGLTWTSCCVQHNGEKSLGFAMSPQEKTRVLQWPGTIKGQLVQNVADRLLSWNGFDAVLALSSCNAVINSGGNKLMAEALTIPAEKNANICVFRYFREKLRGKKVVIIGRYPNLDVVLDGLDYCVLERYPGQNDLPDTAAEYVLPEADWVFITATSLLNKTFHRLAELSRNAVTVLMGPTTPWLESFKDCFVDFIAGVRVVNSGLAEQIVSEGGGTRLFEGGVEYALAFIGESRLDNLKSEIAQCAQTRLALKEKMQAWYTAGNTARFPGFEQLSETESQLSKLDTAYKRLWDASRK